jgi:hypothetical protein
MQDKSVKEVVYLGKMQNVTAEVLGVGQEDGCWSYK